MAIYHLHVQMIGRSNGQSAVAAAAYRSTSKLIDRETGEVCDYSRKEKALNSFILAPDGSPGWATDRNELWAAVMEKENRKNSQFAYSYDVAIPEDIKNDEAMIRAFVKSNFVDRGLIVDANKHAPHKGGDERNAHWHLQVTTRKVTPDGWGEKYRRQEHEGEKNRKGKDKSWQELQRDWLNEIRQSWQNHCNLELERIGSKERIDCRTLEAQGIEREATQHQGPTATAMERKGKKPNRTKERKKMENTIDMIPPNENIVVDLNDFWSKTDDQKLREAQAKTEILNDIPKAEKLIQYEELKARAKATREYLPEIEKASMADFENLKKQVTMLNQEMPDNVSPKPNALMNFFIEWRSSDNKVFKTYEDYAKHQQGIIDRWTSKQKDTKNTDKELYEERVLIGKCKNDKTSMDKDPLNRLLLLSRGQEARRPKLFESIKAKATELLDKSLEFSGFRNLRKIVEDVQNDLAAAAARRRQEKSQEQTQRRGIRR